MPEGTEAAAETTTTETTTAAEETTATTESTEAATTTEETDGEPGGKSPLEVARRKEYEKRVAAEARATALEEQLRAVQDKPAAAKGPFTAEQIQQAINDGTISQVEGTAYLVRMELERAKPLERARAEIDEYFRLAPDLKNPSSDTRHQADAEADRLVSLGFAPGVATSRQAIENVLGRVDQLRRKKESERLTREGARPGPTDPGAGGGGGNKNGAAILEKATETQKAYWKEMNVPVASQIREMQTFLDLKQRQAR